MRELRFTHPDLPDRLYTIPLPDGQDQAGPVASMTDSGWELEADPEAAEVPVEVPVGEPINLTPEPSAEAAAPAEPDNTDQPAPADDNKE
jgi:hypothetical protein